jgi:hypothetical protein
MSKHDDDECYQCAATQTGHTVMIRDQRMRLFCRCFVMGGSVPSDWHAACMDAYTEKKGVPMTADRDALARIIHEACGCDGQCPPGTMRRLEDAQIADAIIAAGWRYDGSCRDCQANLDTNGGNHNFWCATDTGRAQWPDANPRPGPPLPT